MKPQKIAIHHRANVIRINTRVSR